MVLWVPAAIALVACAIRLFAPSTEAASADELPIDPLPILPTRCPFAAAESVRHARTAERMAHVHWERVPVALDEASRALLLIAEAEVCYGARDREGRARSASRRRAYQVEITRRFARSRLLLRLALRQARLDRARQHIALLRALTVRAGDEAQAYRSELEQLDRSYAAQLRERAQGVTHDVRSR